MKKAKKAKSSKKPTPQEIVQAIAFTATAVNCVAPWLNAILKVVI